MESSSEGELPWDVEDVQLHLFQEERIPEDEENVLVRRRMDRIEKPTRLHVEVQDSPKQLLPNEEEKDRARTLRDEVAQCAVRVLGPQAKVLLFGSHAHGLALAGGDCDLVVLGVGPCARLGGRFGRKERVQELLPRLEALRKELKRSGVAPKRAKRIDARVPILKCATADGMPFDVNVGAANGLRAVDLIRKGLEEHEGMQPLVLCVKRFLRERELNEVFTGGMGSYTLFNLMWAHLSASRRLKKNSNDLGELLYLFFVRYGFTFDYDQSAVSMRRGGFVRKERGWPGKPGALQVEDPQEPGKDIAQGTYRIAAIAHEFRKAAKTLEHFHWNAPFREGHSGLRCGSLLDKIFNPMEDPVLQEDEDAGENLKGDFDRDGMSPSASKKGESARGRRKSQSLQRAKKNSGQGRGRKRKEVWGGGSTSNEVGSNGKRRKVGSASGTDFATGVGQATRNNKKRFQVGRRKGKVRWAEEKNKALKKKQLPNNLKVKGRRKSTDGHSKSFGWHTG